MYFYIKQSHHPSYDPPTAGSLLSESAFKSTEAETKLVVEDEVGEMTPPLLEFAAADVGISP